MPNCPVPGHSPHQGSGPIAHPQVPLADRKAVIQVDPTGGKGEKQIGQHRFPPAQRPEKPVDDAKHTAEYQPREKAVPCYFGRGHPISRRHSEPVGRGSS